MCLRVRSALVVFPLPSFDRGSIEVSVDVPPLVASPLPACLTLGGRSCKSLPCALQGLAEPEEGLDMLPDEDEAGAYAVD
jgi:hypothetical protein